MDELNRFKRSIPQTAETEAKRRRVLGALGLGVEANAFLNTSGVSAEGVNLLHTSRLPLVHPSFAFPSTALQGDYLGGGAHDSYTENALRRLILPSGVVTPRVINPVRPTFADLMMADRSLRATTDHHPCSHLLDEAVATTARYENEGAASGFTDLLLEQEAKRRACAVANPTLTLSDFLRAREEEEAQKQAALLLARRSSSLDESSSIARLLACQSQSPSFGAGLPCDPMQRHRDTNLNVRVALPSSLIQTASRIRPDPSGVAIQANDKYEELELNRKMAKATRAPAMTQFCLPAAALPEAQSKLVVPSKKTTQENTLIPKKHSDLPLSTDEDSNWLSEMHCFLRAEIVEVFHVENSKLTGRSTCKGLSAKQVGIRCRWCADLPPESRASRSSAFPSSLRQLYQSFTMMVRDHFGPHNMCSAIPALHRDHLNHLRHSRNSQGASDSKHYWVHAAKRIGMVDTDEGIQVTEESKAAGSQMANFGSPPPETVATKPPTPVVLLVKPDDLNKTSMFLYTLLLQTRLVSLQTSEQVAKRRTLPVGLEGIGCRHCCAAGRYGFSRRFPLRRRSLPEEVMDMYCHMKRCPLCPDEVKDLLKKLHAEHEAAKMSGAHFDAQHRAGGNYKDGRAKDPHREFFDILWNRLGRTHDIKT